MTDFPINIQPRGRSNPMIIRDLKSGRIGYPVGFTYHARFRVRFGVGDFTPLAATSQELDLNTIYPAQAFPTNVHRMPGTFLRVETAPTGGGVGSASAEVGDTGDPNGLLTATSILTVGLKNSTPAAAENVGRVEAAFLPTLTVTFDVNVDTITGGVVLVFVPYKVLPV